MIWLRRVLAIPLIIIFVLLLIAALVLTTLNGTIGNARFYNNQMRQADVYKWVYDNLTPAVLDQIEVESPTDFPIDTPGLKKEIVVVAMEAFPPQWLQETFEGASVQIVPYVVGDKDTFTINIMLQSRITPLADGINKVVDNHKKEIYNYVTEDLIVPAITESLGTNTTLSYGITLTDSEISAAIKAAMPQDWTITQFKEMIDSIAEYMKGETNGLMLTVDLTSVKTAASASLTALADQKLQTYFDGLRTCTLVEFSNQLAGLPPNTLPSCRPTGYTYSQFKAALENKVHMTLDEAVNQAVMNGVPDSWHFNDSEMRQALGEDMASTVDSARDFIVADHGQITEKNFNDSNDTKEFDNVRHTIHTVKMWLWAPWVVAFLLLVAIGFLCGRNWKSRLLWALGVLFVVSLILVIIVAVARTYVPERIVDRPQGHDATQVGIVMADKADQIVHNAINTFVWGLEVKLILFIVLSGLAITGVIVWMIMDRRRRKAAEWGSLESPVQNR